MNLYVVRHGETIANVEQRYLGVLDPGLTESGKKQAEALDALLPQNINVLIASPKLRAQQTAVILNKSLNFQLQTMDCFRERDVGIFEGLTQAEAKSMYPQLWQKNITRQWDVGPPNGESIGDVVIRVQQGLHQLERLYCADNVLLVAHGFVAKTIRALAIDDFTDFYDWQLTNGNLLVLENVKFSTRSAQHMKKTLPANL